jgi:hypothetical protein
MKTKSQKKNKPIYEILPMFMYDYLRKWSPIYDRTRGEPEHAWIVACTFWILGEIILFKTNNIKG